VGIAVDVVCFLMALLSFRGISTPSLKAQGEQRRSSLFNIPRDTPEDAVPTLVHLSKALIMRFMSFARLSGNPQWRLRHALRKLIGHQIDRFDDFAAAPSPELRQENKSKFADLCFEHDGDNIHKWVH